MAWTGKTRNEKGSGETPGPRSGADGSRHSKKRSSSSAVNAGKKLTASGDGRGLKNLLVVHICIESGAWTRKPRPKGPKDEENRNGVQ